MDEYARKLEVHVSANSPPSEGHLLSGLEDAIDLAADQNTETVLTDHGKPIASVVPVDQAERGRLVIVSGAHAGHPHPGDSPCIARGDVVTIVSSETGKQAVREVAHVERNLILLRDLSAGPGD